MVGHNERKLQVLDYIYRYPNSTSADIALALDLEIHNARTLLKKYKRQRLLTRRKVDRWGTRSYEITKKGLKRRKWLRSEKIKAKRSGHFEWISEEETREKEKRGPTVTPKPPPSRSREPEQTSPVERLRKIAELLAQLEDL